MKVLVEYSPGAHLDRYIATRLRKNIKGALELVGTSWVESMFAEPDVVHLISPDDESLAHDAKEQGATLVVSALYSEGDPGARFMSVDGEGFHSLRPKAERLLKEGVTDDVHELKRLSLPVKDKEDVSLMISDLKFMAKGGRCPSLVAKLLSPLPLKVSVYTKEGKLSLAPTLLLGNMGKAVRKYIDSRLRLHEGKIDFSLAALGYTSATKDGVEEAVNHLKSRGFQEVLAVPTNATDACHGGPDVIGFAFRFLD